MRNLFYFLKEFGNVSFQDFAFNEVDSLILCQLSYLNFELFVSEEEVYLLSLLDDDRIQSLSANTFSPKKNVKLLTMLRNARRYQEVKLCHLRNQLSYEDCEQFYAITFIIDDFLYLAFRGTDLTILGWQENFNMAYLKEVPSQRDSVLYVNEIFNHYHRKMIIGGHSKGGNLALYSAMYSSSEVNASILKIYNFDGPGFYNDVFSDQEFLILEDKVVTMSTQEAIIGVLLYHVDNLVFIKSRGFSLLQHEPYNWKVNKAGLLQKVKKNTIQSRWFARAVRHFFEDTSEIERKQFVDLLFTIIEVTPEATVDDFRSHPLKFLFGVQKRYKGLTKEEKRFFKKTLKKFRKSFYHILHLKLKGK